MMLLCSSRCRNRGFVKGQRGKDSVDLTGNVAFEAADDLLLGLALLGAPGYVGPSALVVAHAAQRDHVEGSVGIAVTVTVEPVADGLARRSRNRGNPTQVREGRLIFEP